MTRRMHWISAAILAGVAALAPLSPTRAADSLVTFSDLRGMKIYHVYSANDGKSYLEEVYIPSTEKAGSAGTPQQMYFDLKPVAVRIARAAQNGIFTWHWATENRHLIIPQQGSLYFDLGDGRTLNLKPGEAIYAEDWTGRGHRSGCAASKTQLTCVAIDILIDVNPHTMPLRDPPK